MKTETKCFKVSDANICPHCDGKQIIKTSTCTSQNLVLEMNIISSYFLDFPRFSFGNLRSCFVHFRFCLGNLCFPFRNIHFSDLNKDISDIVYNHLNLPEQIYFGNGNAIEYLYNASGQKVMKKVYDLTTPPSGTIKQVDYLDGFQYAGEVLQFFPHSEGYVSATAGQSNVSGTFTSYIFNYVYNYTDHLGNIRVSYSKDPVNGQLKIMEENHYYPFGLKHTMYAEPKQKYELVEGMENMARPSYVNQTDYQYKYNGKEFQDELNLNLYDYGWRNYDAALGRWMNIDQLAEIYSGNSPYAYVVNNPIRYIDPDGRKIEDPDGLVKDHKNNLKSNKTELQGLIDAGGISAEVGSKLISFFDGALTEISKLEKSEQVYNVFSDKSLTGEGGMTYDSSTGNINIGIGNVGMVGHELLHAYQYENGDISLSVNNSSYGQLYDITDETAGYNRQRALVSTLEFFVSPKEISDDGNPFQIDDQTVRNFGKTMTPPAYQTLPSGPIDINSKEGKALRKQTREAGKLGIPVTEVYKGWQKDYNKGQKK